jgi:hypothetical protein
MIYLKHRRKAFQAAAEIALEGAFQTAQASAVDPHSITITQSPTEGNLIVVTIVADQTIASPPSAVSSSSGNYTKAAEAVDFTGTYVHYRVAGASEATDLSINYSGSANSTVSISEWSGLTNAVDATATNTGQDITTECGPITTVTNDTVLFCVGGSPDNGTWNSWTSPLTEQVDINQSSQNQGVATNIYSSTVTSLNVIATNSQSGSNKSGISVAFK